MYYCECPLPGGSDFFLLRSGRAKNQLALAAFTVLHKPANSFHTPVLLTGGVRMVRILVKLVKAEEKPHRERI